jgi:hypothetical protein
MSLLLQHYVKEKGIVMCCGDQAQLVTCCGEVEKMDLKIRMICKQGPQSLC